MKAPLSLASGMAFAMAAGGSLAVWAGGLGLLLFFVFGAIALAVFVSREAEIEDDAYDLGLKDAEKGIRR